MKGNVINECGRVKKILPGVTSRWMFQGRRCCCSSVSIFGALPFFRILKPRSINCHHQKRQNLKWDRKKHDVTIAASPWVCRVQGRRHRSNVNAPQFCFPCFPPSWPARIFRGNSLLLWISNDDEIRRVWEVYVNWAWLSRNCLPLLVISSLKIRGGSSVDRDKHRNSLPLPFFEVF